MAASNRDNTQESAPPTTALDKAQPATSLSGNPDSTKLETPSDSVDRLFYNSGFVPAFQIHRFTASSPKPFRFRRNAASTDTLALSRLATFNPVSLNPPRGEVDADGLPIRRSMSAPEPPTLSTSTNTHSYLARNRWPPSVPEESIPNPDPIPNRPPLLNSRRPTFSFMRRTPQTTSTDEPATDDYNMVGNPFMDPKLIDVLSTLDPTIETYQDLSNLQNSMFLPFPFRRRQPTLTLDIPPFQPLPPKVPTTRPPTPSAEEASTDTTDVSPTQSVVTSLTSARYAVLPPDVTLKDWSEEEKHTLDEYVRHMLHSRRSKAKQRLRAFRKYASTPLGFFITVYAVLITLFGLAWVLFLIGWINMGEKQVVAINVIDNILVALFAIMGDGLIPFRILDTYRMIFIVHYARLSWKIRKEQDLPDLMNKNDLPIARVDTVKGGDHTNGEKGDHTNRPHNKDREDGGGDYDGAPLASGEGQVKEVTSAPQYQPESGRLSSDYTESIGLIGQIPSNGTDQPIRLSLTVSTTERPFPDLPRDGVRDVEQGQILKQESIETGSFNPEDRRNRPEFSVLTSKQHLCLQHHQLKFAKSHTFYRPHETTTHHAFPLTLLFWIVILFDLHSMFQVALGACTWGISYHVRPMALTTVLLCCSLTANITAGVLVFVGGRKTRKPEVLELLKRQKLTSQAIRRIQKKHEKLKSPDEGTPPQPTHVGIIRRSISGILRHRPADTESDLNSEPKTLMK